MVIRALMLCLTFVAWPAPIEAHSIHSTYSLITIGVDSVATIRMRAFADDFSASVARSANRIAPSDSSVTPDDATRYVRSRITLISSAGKPVALTPCGIRRERDLYWLCYRFEADRGTRIRNLMLTDWHVDQVNVVRVMGRGAPQTMLFTARSDFALLP